MAHFELALHERQVIADMVLAKASVGAIAEKLSWHRSTIYREIKRNTYTDGEMPDLNAYHSGIADGFAAERRHRRRKLVVCPELRDAVIEGFEAGRSPEQIEGRMRHEMTHDTVSHETIYAWVYSKDGQRENFARYLAGRRKKATRAGLGSRELDTRINCVMSRNF